MPVSRRRLFRLGAAAALTRGLYTCHAPFLGTGETEEDHRKRIYQTFDDFHDPNYWKQKSRVGDAEVAAIFRKFLFDPVGMMKKTLGARESEYTPFFSIINTTASAIDRLASAQVFDALTHGRVYSRGSIESIVVVQPDGLTLTYQHPFMTIWNQQSAGNYNTAIATIDATVPDLETCMRRTEGGSPDLKRTFELLNSLFGSSRAFLRAEKAAFQKKLPPVPSAAQEETLMRVQKALASVRTATIAIRQEKPHQEEGIATIQPPYKLLGRVARDGETNERFHWLGNFGCVRAGDSWIYQEATDKQEFTIFDYLFLDLVAAKNTVEGGNEKRNGREYRTVSYTLSFTPQKYRNVSVKLWVDSGTYLPFHVVYEGADVSGSYEFTSFNDAASLVPPCKRPD